MATALRTISRLCGTNSALAGERDYKCRYLGGHISYVTSQPWLNYYCIKTELHQVSERPIRGHINTITGIADIIRQMYSYRAKGSHRCRHAVEQTLYSQCLHQKNGQPCENNLIPISIAKTSKFRPSRLRHSLSPTRWSTQEAVCDDFEKGF